MNKLLILLLAPALLIFALFLIRLISPREIDDVSPEIPCEQEYLEKAQILWIITEFNNKPISENKTWCQKILNLNKTLGLHGVTHQFQEFNTDKNQEYLEKGMKIFKDCFGYEPRIFKPPQLKINTQNKQLIKNNNLKVKSRFNQIIHKVYHLN